MSSAAVPGSDSDPNRHIPSPSIFLDATVLDSSRTSVHLKDVFKTSPESVVAIIFIRHWYCAACQHYIEILSSRISLDDLAKQDAKLIVIGHGEPERIQAYKEHTKCSFDVYTDPSKHLHEELGFVSHGGYDLLFRAGQPSYSDRGVAGELGAFVKGVFSMGSASGGGDVSLLGGEYIFKIDGSGSPTCTYGRRMPGSKDHTPPEILFDRIKEARAALSV